MNTTVKDPDPNDLSRDAIRRAQDSLLEVVAMLHAMEDDPEVHRLIDFDQPNNWPAIANKLHGNVLSTYRWYTSKLEKGEAGRSFVPFGRADKRNVSITAEDERLLTGEPLNKKGGAGVPMSNYPCESDFCSVSPNPHPHQPGCPAYSTEKE